MTQRRPTYVLFLETNGDFILQCCANHDGKGFYLRCFLEVSMSMNEIYEMLCGSVDGREYVVKLVDTGKEFFVITDNLTCDLFTKRPAGSLGTFSIHKVCFHLLWFHDDENLSQYVKNMAWDILSNNGFKKLTGIFSADEFPEDFKDPDLQLLMLRSFKTDFHQEMLKRKQHRSARRDRASESRSPPEDYGSGFAGSSRPSSARASHYEPDHTSAARGRSERTGPTTRSQSDVETLNAKRVTEMNKKIDDLKRKSNNNPTEFLKALYTDMEKDFGIPKEKIPSETDFTQKHLKKLLNEAMIYFHPDKAPDHMSIEAEIITKVLNSYK